MLRGEILIKLVQGILHGSPEMEPDEVWARAHRLYDRAPRDVHIACETTMNEAQRSMDALRTQEDPAPVAPPEGGCVGCGTSNADNSLELNIKVNAKTKAGFCCNVCVRKSIRIAFGIEEHLRRTGGGRLIG